MRSRTGNLRRANATKTAAFFAAELDRAIAPLATFIDEHRHDLMMVVSSGLSA